MRLIHPGGLTGNLRRLFKSGRRSQGVARHLLSRAVVEVMEKRTMLTGTPLYWDPSGAATASGGAGTWDTATLEWRSGSAAGPLVAWSNAGDANGPYQAIFPGSGGTVVLGASVSAVSVSFAANGYALTGGSGDYGLSFAGGIGQIDVTPNSTASISAAVSAAPGLTKTNTGTLNLAGIVTGTATQTLNVETGALVVSTSEAWKTVEVGIAGELVIQGTGSVSGSSGNLSIANAGIVDLISDQSLAGTIGSFTNTGTFEVDNATGSGTTTLSMSFTDSNGTIDVTGGTLSIPGSITLPNLTTMALNGSGTLAVPSLTDPGATIQQDSGTLSISGALNVGGNWQNAAQYFLAGGTLDSGSLYVGEFTTATFTQTGGRLSTGHTEIGSYGNGTLIQSGGTSTYWDMYLGIYGTGTFDLSGGNSTNYTLTDGRVGTGTVDLSGSASLTSSGESVGDEGGLGTFTQTGASTNTTGNFGIGGGSTGIYTLSSGTFSAAWFGVGYGDFGYGTFVQAGGTFYVHTVRPSGPTARRRMAFITCQGDSFRGYNVNIGINGGNGDFSESGGTVDFGNRRCSPVSREHLPSSIFRAAHWPSAGTCISAILPLPAWIRLVAQ